MNTNNQIIMENELSDNSGGSNYSLSCESSPFEHDVDEASGEEEVEQINPTPILPYQFEPEMTDDDSDHHPNHDYDSDSSDDLNRLADNSWCSCNHCIVMPTALECRCCKEIPQVQKVINEFPGTTCITLHPGFQTVCLDVHVLRVAYYQYRQQYGEHADDGNKRKRYVAYRQFVRWNWGYLGKEVRVVIPACAVEKIRSVFPEPDQQYTGFQQ